MREPLPITTAPRLYGSPKPARYFDRSFLYKENSIPVSHIRLQKKFNGSNTCDEAELVEALDFMRGGHSFVLRGITVAELLAVLREDNSYEAR